MRTVILASFMLLPLLAGCSLDEPLAPELKGRWATPDAAKLRLALLANHTQAELPVPRARTADCTREYVTFGKKRGISLHIDGKVYPVFVVREVKRERSRLILVGQAPVTASGQAAKIEFKLRDGQVRFDDIVDERGRSILYDRFEHEHARRFGITSVGDVFRPVLDIKPCRT
jgi:hypothetical protein